MDQAMQLEEKGENDQALAIWKEAVALDPSNAKAQNGLGISLYVHGEKDEAFSHLREAVRINPLAVDNHYVLGKFLLEQGHPDEAVRGVPDRGDDPAALSAWGSGPGECVRGAGQRWRSPQPLAQSARHGSQQPERDARHAWLLATAPDGTVRNGREALVLAQNADSAGTTEDPAVLDTLAAAWAENWRVQPRGHHGLPRSSRSRPAKETHNWQRRFAPTSRSTSRGAPSATCLNLRRRWRFLRQQQGREDERSGNHPSRARGTRARHESAPSRIMRLSTRRTATRNPARSRVGCGSISGS